MWSICGFYPLMTRARISLIGPKLVEIHFDLVFLEDQSTVNILFGFFLYCTRMRGVGARECWEGRREGHRMRSRGGDVSALGGEGRKETMLTIKHAQECVF